MATQITINTEVALPPATVWEYWNSPEHITGWNFASEDWHCPQATNDLRVGGKLVSRMEAKDGSFGFDFEGEYTEVMPHSRIAYRLGDGRHVWVDFNATAAGTAVTCGFEAEDTNPHEMQRGGWQAILDNFKRYAEAQ